MPPQRISRNLACAVTYKLNFQRALIAYALTLQLTFQRALKRFRGALIRHVFLEHMLCL